MEPQDDCDHLDEPLRPEEPQEEEEWWEEYAVPDELTVEAGEDELREFEDLLEWIEAEMELEIAENCMYLVLFCNSLINRP
jgi:hypothetical protein